MDFTPASAMRAAQAGRIEAWLHAFLTTTGNNVPLSLGLKLAPRWYLGPVRFPLAPRTLPRPRGGHGVSRPDGAMYRDDGVLSVRDGNNRHGALSRSGVRDYWTIVWFNPEEHQRQFAETYDAYL